MTDKKKTARALREPYLPETVKQALASVRRARGQVYRAGLVLPLARIDGLLGLLEKSHKELCRVERRLRRRALPMARQRMDGVEP